MTDDKTDPAIPPRYTVDKPFDGFLDLPEPKYKGDDHEGEHTLYESLARDGYDVSDRKALLRRLEAERAAAGLPPVPPIPQHRSERG